ncbi:MAG: choice-of-anchor Q domain-containing protein, partial [Bacteroidales bacterium]
NIVKNQVVDNANTDYLFTATTNILYNYKADKTAGTSWNRNNTALVNQNLNLSASLADNGSLNGTQTLAVLSGSFAAGAGLADAAVTTDQRGLVRHNPPTIGAYEYEGMLPPATLSDFTPTTAAAGATVTITGTYFTGATVVSFGGTAAASFSVVNSTTITAVVGSGTSGSVSVTSPNGTATKTGFIFDIRYSGGVGSSEDPYQISTLEDLAELSATPLDWVAGIYFIQTADIDASATSTLNPIDGGGFYGFTPIAFGLDELGNNYDFYGSYNGQNHTITSLYINRLGAANYVALFGSGDGTFLNIKLINPEIYGANGTGGLIGQAGQAGACTVTSCEVTGGIIQGSGSWCGGLIGYALQTIISSSAVHGVAVQTIGEVESYGGLVGYANECTVSSCSVTETTISATNGGFGYYFGGLIGNAGYCTIGNCTVNSCSLTMDDVDGDEQLCGGLVGNSDHNTITSCEVTSVVINSFSDCGGLIGKSWYDNISSCVVTDGVIHGSNYVGGLIGFLFSQSKIITKCAVVNGNIESAGNSAGGLIGYVVGITDFEPVISQCFSAGSVVGTGSYDYGGLIGIGQDFVLTDCYSTASVTGTNEAGGLVGWAAPASITNCYSTGLVICPGSTAGGFVSYNTGTSTNCFWDTETSEQIISAGTEVGKSTAEMKTQGTFTGWDFETTPVWHITADNDGYPHLAWQTFAAVTIWKGTASADWNTAGNWSTNIVPTSSDNVLISNVTNDPLIASGIGASCNNLTVNSSANLTLASGGSLITTGTITNSGTINAQRTISNGIWHLISLPN